MEGLTTTQVHELLKKHGHNVLPKPVVPSILWTFIKQFFSPLIYVLIAAAVVAFFLGEMATSIFIFFILCLNSLIGGIQERSAQKAVISLQHFMPSYIQVVRDGEVSQINAEDLVPGDVILLSSGTKIPADVELIETTNFMVDESLLTGESMPVERDAGNNIENNKAFGGTTVIRGRAKAKVLATGLNTKIGAIAKSVTTTNIVKPPLLQRIEKFTVYLSAGTVIFIVVFSLIAFTQIDDIAQVLVLAVALAVAAVPEGLPTSVTVTLAVGVYRMSKSNVIVRKLLAVESLGSCTYIMSDKTGTLTQNKLAVNIIGLPDGEIVKVDDKHILNNKGKKLPSIPSHLKDLVLTGVLANEAYQKIDEFSGDVVDIAFLKLGNKANINQKETFKKYKVIRFFPYESENRYSAGAYKLNGKKELFIKGSCTQVLPMCSLMQSGNKQIKFNKSKVLKQIEELAAQGYRMLAVAKGDLKGKPTTRSFANLTLLGVVGMADPLRPEAKKSIQDIKQAGVKVAMVTGDHPITAFAIARNLGMDITQKDIVTGEQIQAAVKAGEFEIDKLVKDKQVFAHIEPLQKKVIVEALMRAGHYVAVTGDGVNDAPALKYAHIGVAMGKEGTDIARDSSDIILTDNNFTSIVKGILHGRVVYSNIRKVIFLLISTGIAEILLFALALLFKQPMPMLAIHLLWLNLIINGVQDEAVGFEPVEGNELETPPPKPDEAIFNRLMIGRVLMVGIYIGIVSFLVFYKLLDLGYDGEQARNMTLLLMVLFGNIQAFMCKSEHHSVLKTNIFDNKFLFFGIIGSQIFHIIAMYIPLFKDIFHLYPVTLKEWGILLVIASSLFIVEGIYRNIHYKLDKTYVEPKK